GSTAVSALHHQRGPPASPGSERLRASGRLRAARPDLPLTKGLPLPPEVSLTTPAAPRVAGKRGRLRAEPVALRFLHEYARQPLPAPVYPVDVRGGIADDAWGMLGNGPDPACSLAPDGVGDCGFAGRQHARMAKAACYGETETWETSDQLVREYLVYDHGQDAGVSLPAVLRYWYRKGKIRGFAPVDHTDPAAVDAAMQAFKGVYAGVDLTGDADQLFEQGQPWTTANGEQ